MNKLKLRNTIKKKKPSFLRQDAHKKSKLKNNWRRAKGIQSKMRLKFRGHRKSPNPGYGSPREVRGLTKEGLMPVLINNLNDLKEIKDNKSALISNKVGNRKRLMILEKVKEKNLKILHIKVDDEINKIKKSLEERKKKSRKKVAERKKERKASKEKEEKKIEAAEKPKEEKVEDKVKGQKKKEDIQKKKVLEKKTTKN